MSRIIIDPLTRISGLLRIDVEINNNKITDANVSGSQFRGFERMFQDREPFDIIRLAPRICGICSTHHTMAATEAMEDALKVVPDFNGRVARDITNGFEFLQNYLRHIYFFVFPDYVNMVKVNPLFKTESEEVNDYRLNAEDTAKIINQLQKLPMLFQRQRLA